MDPLKKLVFFVFHSQKCLHELLMCACTSVSVSPEPLPQRGAFGLSRMQWHHQSGLRDKVHHAEMRNPLNCTCVRAWVCVCVKCWQIGLWAPLPHTGTSCSLYSREILGQEWGFHHKKVWISKVFHRCALLKVRRTLCDTFQLLLGKDYYHNLI